MNLKFISKSRIAVLFIATFMLFSGVGSYLPGNVFVVQAATSLLTPGDNYEYQIEPESISIGGKSSGSYSTAYTGTLIEPKVKVTVRKRYMKDCTDSSGMHKKGDTVSGITKAQENVDYEVRYSYNRDVGTAQVLVRGINGVSGKAPGTFKITAKSINSSEMFYNCGAGYSYRYGDEIVPSLVVADTKNNVQLIKDKDYTVSYENNINAGIATAHFTGTGNYTGTVNKTFQIERAFLPRATVSNSTYNGDLTAVPSISITDPKGNKLINGKDYTASFQNANKVGTATAIIQGIGNYQGTTPYQYCINPMSITKITIGDLPNYTYNNQECKPKVSAKGITGETLHEGVDYTVSYSNNKNAGTATVTVQGIGNYTGTTQKTFKINAAPINGATISNLASKTITGKPITQDPTVVLNGRTLQEGTDYEVTYSNNANVGTAKIIIKGKGNYTGTCESTFEIVPKDIQTLSVSGLKSKYLYTGKEIVPGFDVFSNDTKLTLNEDYTFKCTNNTKVGTATLVINGINNYSGSIQKTFEIVPKDVKTLSVSGLKTEYSYTGKEIAPDFDVFSDDTKLTSNKDYTFEYIDNIEVGTAKVVIKGKGNYTGTYESTFEIVPKDVQNLSVSGLKSEYLYTGKEIVPSFEVLDDTKLILNEDYTFECVDNIEVGTATLVINGINNYSGSIRKTFKIYKNDVKAPEITENASDTSDGLDDSNSSNLNDSNSTDTSDNLDDSNETNDVNYINTKTDIKDATVSVQNVTYSGKASKPNVLVKYYNKVLTLGKDYTVSYKNNKNVGTATVTITGKGSFNGSKSVSFIINPKATTLSKVTAKKKSFVAKWKKQDKQTDGYQVQYSLNKNMKSAKLVTIKKNKTMSTTIKKLKAKKTYYVQIRTYKTVNGKKYYSTWSNTKSVRIK